MEIRALFSTDTRQLDTAKQKLAGVGDAGQESGRDIAKGMKTAEKSTGVFQSALKGLGSVLGTIGLAYSLGGVITQNTAYANSLSEVSTLVNTTTFNMESLSDEALNQANRFGAMPVDGTKAFYQAISAGASSAAEATETMVDANKLAIGGVTDVKTAVDGLTSANNAYGESAGGTTAISDSMFVAMRAGKTTIGELSGSIGNLAPISAQAGASFDEMMAATAALTKGGVSTSTAMDGLKGILASVIKPSGEAAKMASSLGLEFNAAALKSKGFAGFLQDVTDKTGGSTEKMAMLFGGVEALAPMLALTGKASGDFAETLAAMANKAGATEEAFTKMSNSPGFQIQRIIAGISAEFIKLGQGGTDIAVVALKAIADNLGIISTAGNFLISVADAVIDKLQQFGVIDAVVTGFQLAGDAINYVSEMFTGTSGGITEFLGTFGAIAVTAGGVSAAIGVVSMAISAMGAILLANPITLTIAAIGTAVYLIYNNWDGVVAWWDNLWSGVESAASGFFDWWNNTTLIEKVADIATYQIDAARSVATGFFTWWDQSTLKEHSPPIVTDAVDSARNFIGDFFSWWDHTSLEDKAADVTYELIKTAWDYVETFYNWWNSWSLIGKNISADASILEKAEAIARRFVDWWQGLTLKSLIPDIKMPDIGGAVSEMTAAGSDIAKGLGDGLSRGWSYVKSKAQALGKVPEQTVREVTDTRSPSRVMAEVGLDVSMGFATGIESGGSKVKSAAEKAAQAAETGFNRIIEGLEKQYLKLTEGDEAARRYELSMQGVIGANQDAVVATEAQIKSLEDQKAVTDEAAIAAKQNAAAQVQAAKAVQDAIDQLNQGVQKQILALTEGEESSRRYELSLQKITGSAADAIIAGEQHVKALTDQKKAADDAAKAAETFQKTIDGLHAGLDKQIISLTKGTEAAFRHELELKKINGTELKAIIAKQRHIEAIKKQQQLMTAGEAVYKSTRTDAEKLADEVDRLGKLHSAKAIDANTYQRAIKSVNEQYDTGTKAATEYAKESKELAAKIKILEAGLGGNEEAARRAELGLKGYNAAQVKGLIADENRIEKLQETSTEFENLHSAAGGIADSIIGGDWSGALGQLKSVFIEPFKDQLSGMLQNVLSDGSGGGLLGGLQSGLSGIMGGLSNGISGLFGGGGLGSIMGALGPAGLIAGAIPLITSLFSSGPQDVTGKFGSFGSVVQDKNSVANKPDRTFYQTGRSKDPLHRTSDFGQFGLLSDGSQSVGRDSDEQIAAIQAALDGMQQLDNVIASFLPAAQIERVQANLDGLTSNALNTEEMTRERLTTIFSSMDGQLKNAFQGGMNVMAGTTEEIAGRFAYIAQVNESVLPTFDQLGFNLGNTETAALAAAVGLADAAGGIEQLLAGTQSYVDKFYTDTEKQNLAMSAAAAQVEQFNAVLGRTGVSAVDSREEFRSYVDSLDLTTKAGQEAYAEAMAVVDSMYAVSESGQTLDEIMSSLPKAMLNNAKAMLDQADIVEKAGGGTEKALGGVGDSLASLTKSAAKSASSIASAAAKISSIKITSKSDSGLIALPKFATGGITSGTSIAGEAGPEAVIPLPDGRTVPVSLTMPDMSAFQRTEVYHKGSVEFIDDQRDLKWAQTQYHYQEQNTYGGNWDKEQKRLREKTRWAMDESTFTAYESGIAGLESQFLELTSVASNLEGIDWNDDQFSGWNQAMKDSYKSAHDAVAAAQLEYDAKQALIEQQQQIESDYQNALKSASDFRYEIKYGADALRERQMLESGFNQAQIASIISIEKEVAALEAEKSARDEAIASIEASKSAHSDALQSEADRRIELLHGADYLEREIKLREGWTESMIDGWSAQKSSNDELERQIGVYDSLKSMAVDLRTAANDLQFDSSLGLSSPAEMLSEARSEVDRLAASAVNDPEAAAALSGAVQNALQLSREYNASSTGYVTDFERMTGLLDSVASEIDALKSPTVAPSDLTAENNVIDARPVFNQQQQNTEKDRRIEALEKQNNDLQKQMVEILKELRDDQREIAVDAFEQRAESNDKQSDTKKEIKQLREQQRTDARFQGVA